MKFQFRKIKLGPENKVRLDLINSIVEEYQGQGYVLTLRQLYYQLVSRDVVPNTPAEYEKLSVLLKEGRMGGIVDWDAIEDRVRRPSTPASWDSPSDILLGAAAQFALPRMRGQETYLEVWVEKDALSGVLSRVTRPYHVPIMVNRGYSSASAMYEAYRRFENKVGYSNCKKIRILYLGDFDPSGVDMVRDVESRICEFFLGKAKSFDKCVVDTTVRNKPAKKSCLHFPHLWPTILKEKLKIDFKIVPIALTREQIDLYEPPPNPAKRTDKRFAKFKANHGDMSWEVDALRPEVLNEILTKSILEHIDVSLYEAIVAQEKEGRRQLRELNTYLDPDYVPDEEA
jgi:hypothetical protein